MTAPVFPMRAAPLRSAVLLLALLPALLLAGCASGGPERPRRATDLVNFQLGPEYSHWLVGPIVHMATDEEVQAYLELTEDLDAVDFIEAFWRRRDPDPEERGNPLRRAFQARLEVADRRYSEAGILGRRTARGTVHVLHGEPESVEFEIDPRGGGPIEVWRYPADAPPGLDGRPPASFYRFQKVGELTRFYRPQPRRPGRPIGM